MQQLDPRRPSPPRPSSPEADYLRSNAGKLVLEDTYDAEDPRPYFTALAPLDYHIPTAARPMFERIIEALRRTRGSADTRPLEVVDVGCSYGVNAAVLKYGLAMSELYAWYASPEVGSYTAEELIARDRALLGARSAREDLRVTGIDVAPRAVAYARAVGFLDDGYAVNLEDPAAGPPPLRMPMDLITSTGCVGYVTERTFARLLASRTGPLPWIATFVLRMFPFDRIAATLEGLGYVTDRLVGRTFVQRRFASEGERRHVLTRLREIGVDPRGKESEGTYHAQLYLSRPRGEHDGSRLDVLLGLS